MNLSLTDISLPSYVKTALEGLENGGFEAYAVGGCVRDALIGKTPDDWDITTSALPEETKSCFPDRHIIETGIKHGTVTVRIDSQSLEITTFRTDGEYTDHRHPESVSFSRKLGDDLSRRDFTVNAMCYSPKTGIVDLFDGRKDLEGGIIRCVGDARKRFDEDALRIMRCLRFAAVLGFSVEQNTAEAAHEMKALLREVSAERIFTELKKMLKGMKTPDIALEFRDTLEEVFPQMKAVPEDEYLKACTAVTKTDDTVLTLALFFSALDENQIKEVFAYLKSDRKTRDAVLFLCRNKKTELTDKGDVFRLAGESDCKYIKELKDFRAILYGGSEDVLCGAINDLKSSVPVKPGDLAVNGNDIAALGIKGRAIGFACDALLHAVWYEELENTRDKLLAYLADKLTRFLPEEGP